MATLYGWHTENNGVKLIISIQKLLLILLIAEPLDWECCGEHVKMWAWLGERDKKQKDKDMWEDIVEFLVSPLPIYMEPAF